MFYVYKIEYSLDSFSRTAQTSHCFLAAEVAANSNKVRKLDASASAPAPAPAPAPATARARARAPHRRERESDAESSASEAALSVGPDDSSGDERVELESFLDEEDGDPEDYLGSEEEPAAQGEDDELYL